MAAGHRPTARRATPTTSLPAEQRSTKRASRQSLARSWWTVEEVGVYRTPDRGFELDQSGGLANDRIEHRHSMRLRSHWFGSGATFGHDRNAFLSNHGDGDGCGDDDGEDGTSGDDDGGGGGGGDLCERLVSLPAPRSDSVPNNLHN